jgi:hypothetical protein
MAGLKESARNTANASFRWPDSNFLSSMVNDYKHARGDIRNDRGHDEDLGWFRFGKKTNSALDDPAVKLYNYALQINL